MPKKTFMIANLAGKEEFIKEISAASYHFADDTAKGRQLARAHQQKAADIALENNWQVWQVWQVEDVLRESGGQLFCYIDIIQLMLTTQARSLQLAELRIELGRKLHEYTQLEARYGTGVRPSWVSTDLALLQSNINQLRSQIAELPEDAK